MDEMADKQVMRVEHHCLQLRYAHLRAQNPRTLEMLTSSIEQYGQLVPVIIVPEEEAHQWVLIDGYHRVRALKRLSKDTIEAEVWNCPIKDALMRMLRSHPTRTPGILEEALVLHELHSHCGLSQQGLAADYLWLRLCQILLSISYQKGHSLYGFVCAFLLLLRAQYPNMQRAF